MQLDTTKIPLSMEFSRQEYWSGLLFPSPEDLLDPGTDPCLLCLLHWQTDSLPLEPPGKPQIKLGVKANHGVCSRNSRRGKSVVSHQGHAMGMYMPTQNSHGQGLLHLPSSTNTSSASGKHDRSRNLLNKEVFLGQRRPRHPGNSKSGF